MNPPLTADIRVEGEPAHGPRAPRIEVRERKRAFKVLWWLSLTPLVFACAPKLVILNGVEMTYEEAAKRLYEQGQKALHDGDPTTARARFKEVLFRFEESKQVAEAEFALGSVLQSEEGCMSSRPVLSKFLQSFPSHSKAEEAKAILAKCEASGAPPVVSDAIYRQSFEAATSDPARKDVAVRAAEAGVVSRDHGAAVRWLLQAKAVEPDASARTALDAKIVDLIDRRLSFVEVRQLLEEGSGTDSPRDVLTYKLGRIQYHTRDLPNAKETLTRFLETWPNSPYVQGAKDLLGLIEARGRVEPMTIGVLLPLSGVHKAFGEHALEAIRLGLGKGSKIKLAVRDTKSDRVVARRVVEELALEEGALVLLGGIFSYEAEPAAYKAQELGIPFLTITKSDVARAGPYVFRNAMSDEAEMSALVAYAMDVLGMKTFAILHPRHTYGEELLNLFWDEVEEREGEIRGIESYDKDDTTFSRQVKRLVARDRLESRGDYRRAIEECGKQPDAYRKSRCKEQVQKDLKPLIDFDGLFIPDYPRSVAMISAALAFEDIIVEKDPRRLSVIRRTLGYEVQPVTLLGTSGWNSEKLVESSGRTVENAIFTDAYFAGAEDRVAVEFSRAFKQAHGRTPMTYPEALMYDCIRLLKSVIEKESPPTREAMREAMRRVHDFPGATGKISFLEGNDAARPARILSIKDGSIVEIPTGGEVKKSRRKKRS